MAENHIGLKSINNPRKKLANCHIVFIHGLNGNSNDTWLNSENQCFWPNLIANNIKTAKVWSLGYEVHSSAWQGHTMTMYDRALNTLEWLILKLTDGLPIFFICHSFGGLLIKEVLRIAQSSHITKHSAFLGNVKGIVFVSTPHNGSELATYFDFLSVILQKSVTIDELKPSNPHLRLLNDWYRNNANYLGISTLVFYETKRTRKFLVVNPYSANPGIENVQPIPMDDDHISICRPASKDSLIHIKVIDFLDFELKKNF